jgi:diguanylate cyclase (GGDEF)-like protein
MMRGESLVDPAAQAPLLWSQAPMKLSFTDAWFESKKADRYRYRLLGVSDAWSLSAGPEVTYSSLAPGHYRLEVMMVNDELQLQSAVTAVDFDLAPPWWRTSVFYALCLVAAAGLVRMLYAWRVRRYAQQQRHLEELVAQRTFELEASHEQMRELALRDGLTGVWNRRALMSMLDAELSRAQREHMDLTLVIVDADHFKRINDVHGHLAGDAVLKELAARLQKVTRSYDVVGRYGGEEFLLLLPGLDVDRGEYRRRIGAFHQVIGGQAMAIGDGQEVMVTCSFGVAHAKAGEQVSGEALIGKADAALYQAKAAGRNCIVYAAAP